MVTTHPGNDIVFLRDLSDDGVRRPTLVTIDTFLEKIRISKDYTNPMCSKCLNFESACGEFPFVCIFDVIKR